VPRSIEARFTFAVLAYAALQVVLRLLIGPSLELDEAEAFYQSRTLAWGYGPQPPLYFWLQWGLFRVLGPGLLALALLKALILSGTVLGVFALLRREAGAGAAAVAALSLSLLPAVVWEGQRALTHSMLALFMAVLAANVFAGALRTGRWWDHLALGAVLGLGAISKLNFALWPLGLVAAAVVLPEWRGRLRPWRLIVALGVGAAVVAPVGLWMLWNPELAASSVRKLEVADGGTAARMLGTGDLFMAALSFLGLALLVLGGFVLVRRGQGNWPPVARLLVAASGFSVVILWLGLLASAATEVAERWLLPLGWAVVPVTTVWLLPSLGGRGRRGLAWTAGGVWLLVVPLLPYASLVDPGYRGANFGPLIDRLRARAAEERLVQVDSQWVAGNLAYLAPDLTPHLLRPGEIPEIKALLVLEKTREAGPRGAAGHETVMIPHGRRAVQLTVIDQSD
jgi:4-amino-4-deoxy-L-arabinose transferase-like glycosyltransferase